MSRPWKLPVLCGAQTQAQIEAGPSRWPALELELEGLQQLHQPVSGGL